MNPKCVEALRLLVESKNSPYPGAIGRAGTILVRYDLARRLGPVTYAGTYRQQQIPERWVAFELTPAGKTACKELGLL